MKVRNVREVNTNQLFWEVNFLKKSRTSTVSSGFCSFIIVVPWFYLIVLFSIYEEYTKRNS